MLFNSFEFLFLFLPLTFALYRLACANGRAKSALAVLTAASLLFYSYWNPPYVLLILFSMAFNFSVGRVLTRFHDLKRSSYVTVALVLGCAVNLLLIGWFKYANFLAANLAPLLGRVWVHKEIFLPLGISFFTFQQIAYLADAAKGLTRGHSFLQYALFVTFFPQLIAGPIVHYGEIIPQFQKRRFSILSWRNIAFGLSMLALGLFKKVVIADTMSPFVADAFDNTDTLTFFEAWGGALAYTFQIYFDFSGYSDMAIGLGKLFNIDIPVNFNSPYKACSIIDFWRRWHMTLSHFLRDYLYVPLGGNRKGRVRRYVNLLITMLLGGLWHGANWTFVFWGFLHGIYLCANHLWRAVAAKWRFALPRAVAWVITFASVVFAWIFFRAPTFSRAWSILLSLAGLHGVALPVSYVPSLRLRSFLGKFIEICPIEDLSGWYFGGMTEAALLPLLMIFVVVLPNSLEWVDRNTRFMRIKSALFVGTVLACAVLCLARVSEFLYFQF